MNVSAWFPDAIIIITYSLISVENLWDSTTTPQALRYFFAVDAMTGDFAVVDEDGENQFLHRAIYDRCLNKHLRKKKFPRWFFPRAKKERSVFHYSYDLRNGSGKSNEAYLLV